MIRVSVAQHACIGCLGFSLPQGLVNRQVWELFDYRILNCNLPIVIKGKLPNCVHILVLSIGIHKFKLR